MTNFDPRKKCFHVVLSGQSGGNGTMGSVPPELLAFLFARSHESNLLYPKCSRKAHKKRKQSTL
jgi:hypothetical protein